ncbi:hypothetical protein DPMN_083546 [Dreissena polymorpha]|uniref:Uncharacterized protein n=2 Tax=Dreissena polymorpha TaxID=45954 RepID=A0A9D4BJY4_DREPO|nr:hypothetical protein DPMN_083546 [Dreissena polymorpha]
MKSDTSVSAPFKAETIAATMAKQTSKPSLIKESLLGEASVKSMNELGYLSKTLNSTGMLSTTNLSDMYVKSMTESQNLSKTLNATGMLSTAKASILGDVSEKSMNESRNLSKTINSTLTKESILNESRGMGRTLDSRVADIGPGASGGPARVAVNSNQAGRVKGLRSIRTTTSTGSAFNPGPCADPSKPAVKKLDTSVVKSVDLTSLSSADNLPRMEEPGKSLGKKEDVCVSPKKKASALSTITNSPVKKPLAVDCGPSISLSGPPRALSRTKSPLSRTKSPHMTRGRAQSRQEPSATQAPEDVPGDCAPS